MLVLAGRAATPTQTGIHVRPSKAPNPVPPRVRALPANEPRPAAQSSSSGNGTAAADGNGSAKPPASKTGSHPAQKNGNGSAAASGFNHIRNEFLTVARRVATSKKQPIAEVVEWASGGRFGYGDVARMTEADMPKLRAANELIASALAGTAR